MVYTKNKRRQKRRLVQMINKVLKSVLMVMLVVLCVSASACMVRLPVGMNAVDVEDVNAYYDDPVQGWYVEGYWTGGCLGCGVWVAPFWATDNVVIYNHWDHYRGRHYSDLHRHFGRYGGFTHGGYRHNEYMRDRDRYRGRDHHNSWQGDRLQRKEHFEHQGRPRNESPMRAPPSAHEPQRGRSYEGGQIQRPHNNRQQLKVPDRMRKHQRRVE